MVLDIPDDIGSVTIYNKDGKYPFRVVLTSRDFKIQVGCEGTSMAEAYRLAYDAFRAEKKK